MGRIQPRERRLFFRFENGSLDTDRRELHRAGESVAVEPQVFDLLVYLVQNRDRVVSKDDLIASVWKGRIVSDSTLTSRITAVRHAIDDSGERQRLIRTVPRKGFRFVGIASFASRAETDVIPNAPLAASPMPMPALALLDKPSIAVLPFH